MLRHDNNSEMNAPPAAQVRVTPQELAAALARPEARQQENHPRTRFLASNRAGVSVIFVAALVVFGGMVAFLRAPIHSPLYSPPVAVTASATPQAVPIGIPDTLLVQRPDHKMVLLSEAADNQTVLCNLAGTEDSAHLADFAPGIYHWTLIKHGGKVYVRGWIGDISGTALRSTIVEVHPGAYWVPRGMKPIRVTLPLGGFRSPPGLTNDNVISASHLVPDERLKEKW